MDSLAELNCYIMYKKEKVTQFLRSVVAIPLFAMVVPFSGASAMPDMTKILITNTDQASVIITQEDQIRKDRAEKIDTYFKGKPLEGYGMEFVKAAERHDLDWRLLPAIAMRESTGGVYACKKADNSVFGYGSCKMSFKSIPESIERVAESLGGNNPNTAHYYDGKTTKQILRKYNSVIKNYPDQVLSIMNKIGPENESTNQIVIVDKKTSA